jgi:hypothetical protein
MVMSTTTSQHNQLQNIMVFLLVLALSGLENLVAEIIPELQLGPLEIGISSFFFVPLVLVILFNNWWAALAAPIGELLFADIVLGEFGGLGEFEEVVLVTVALMIAARIAKDPKNSMMVLIAGVLAYVALELPATLIDITKVVIGVEEFEAVEGLPESIFVLEFIDFAIEFIISGVIFGAIPAMVLAPQLYGKIEPLMGMQPRSIDENTASDDNRLWIAGGIAVVAAAIIAIVSEQGLTIVEWEPEFLDSIGEWFIYVGMTIAAVVAAVSVIIAGRSAQK